MGYWKLEQLKYAKQVNSAKTLFLGLGVGDLLIRSYDSHRLSMKQHKFLLLTPGINKKKASHAFRHEVKYQPCTCR